MPYELRSRHFLLSCAVFAAYLAGIILLGRAEGLSWNSASAFWVEIINSPLWLKGLSAVTILSGTLLIYFIPGVFIARGFADESDTAVGVWAKGFLLNYLFYYFSSTLYKLLFHREFSREVMVFLCALFILTAPFITLSAGKQSLSGRPRPAPSRNNLIYGILFLTVVIFVCSVSWKNIFLLHFGGDGDGVEQFWLAQSVKSMMLPTSFREFSTLIPQFPFAPSVYLNMFVLTLFGDAEFIVKIEVLVAFIWLGFLLKGVIEVLSNGKKLTPIESLPLLLYMAILFLITCHRAAYQPPTELAKANEIFQLALFICGFYFLAKREARFDVFATVFFIMAAMIRHNGLLMVTFFIIIFSLIFRRYMSVIVYLFGSLLLVAVLNILLIGSPVSFSYMLSLLFRDLKYLGTTTEGFDPLFTVKYLWNFFVFTSGMAVFLVIGLRKRYIAIMALTTALYLLLPLRSVRVPAHFYVPVIIFPLISFYLADIRYRKIITGAIIILELICLAYLFPKEETSRATSFVSVLSKICLNTDDLFKASQRSGIVNDILGVWLDERIIMYYADIFPKKNKEYLLYFGSQPPPAGDYDLRRFGDDSINLYMLRSPKQWQSARGEIAIMMGDYHRGNKPYVLYRYRKRN